MALLAGFLVLSACAAPVQVRRVDARRVHRQLTSNVLSTGHLSRRTQNLLYDRDFVERYEDDPAGALAALHTAVAGGELGPDETAGVAELAFLHAENGGETKVTIAGQEVPLEAEPTAAMALTLAETKIWSLEATGFLRGAGVIEERAQLVSMRPYRRGLTPFVFAHGTGSSAARWAQLANDLGNHPRIHP